MKTFSSLKKNKAAFGLSIVLSVFAIVSLVSASTSIGTNIQTAGTLIVSGLSTLANVTATSLTVGSSGTALSQIVKGTCVLTNYGVSGTGIDVSQAASSTAIYQCAADSAGTALTGVASGYTTLVQLSTTTAETGNGWAIIGSSASSTAGYINVIVSNLSGAARVPSSAGVGSSTSYIVIQ